MTDPLDTLRPEVREAVHAIDHGNGVFVDSDDGIGAEKWRVIRAELLRLARDNDALRSKCNVIMSGSTQHLGRAERAEAELSKFTR